LRSLDLNEQAPEFTIDNPPQFANSLKLELPKDFVSQIVSTLNDSLEKIADGVEELANALSEVELFSDMKPINDRLRAFYNIARHLNILLRQTKEATETIVVTRAPPPKAKPALKSAEQPAEDKAAALPPPAARPATSTPASASPSTGQSQLSSVAKVGDRKRIN